MTAPRLSVLLLLLLAGPAFAQTGVLQLPKLGTAGDSQTSQPARPRAAPVAPVLRGTVGKLTPVVQAPSGTHAQRPAGTTAAARAPAADPHAEPPADKGSVTGLPLPRFAALRSDDVNMRVGPGMRYPIEWQYHRRDLPVEILRELDVWRLVEDQDGVKGWVHQATLTGRRGFVVKEREAVMRRSPSDDAAPVARLMPGVVGRLRACAAAAAWCEVQVHDYRGWLRRSAFWGTFPGEAVGN